MWTQYIYLKLFLTSHQCTWILTSNEQVRVTSMLVYTNGRRRRSLHYLFTFQTILRTIQSLTSTQTHERAGQYSRKHNAPLPTSPLSANKLLSPHHFSPFDNKLNWCYLKAPVSGLLMPKKCLQHEKGKAQKNRNCFAWHLFCWLHWLGDRPAQLQRKGAYCGMTNWRWLSILYTPAVSLRLTMTTPAKYLV
jgi:hypothetical protein